MKRRSLLFVFVILALTCTLIGMPDTAQAQGTAQVIVHNRTGGLVYVNFFGPQDYYLQLGTGKHKLELEMGKYTYSYWVCNSWQTGSFNLTKFGESIDLKSCESGGNTSSTEAAAQDLPQVKLDNQTGQAVRITFNGTTDYTFTAATGISRYELKKGRYTYSYWGCGGWQNGNLTVTNYGSSLELACATQPNTTVDTSTGSTSTEKTSASATSELMLKNFTDETVTVYIVDIGKTYHLNGTIKITLPLGNHSYIVWVSDDLPVFGSFRTYVEKSELKFLKNGNIVFNSP
ncbi:MAG: hypothetical protein JXB38_19590 [Anaerolineales bacterium]|nr:hypothetical protein [Anaerolineales bacterium]